jgi:GT2 family glycosyltransferase
MEMLDVTGLQSIDRESTLITAILTCHNRRELTVRCLASYFAQKTSGWELNAVLVDDGSTDGTADEVRRTFPDVEVIEEHGSLFWAAGMAAAERVAKIAQPAYILWLNDDVILQPHAIAQLVDVSLNRSQQRLHLISGAVASELTRDVTYGGVQRRDRHPMRFSLVSPNGSLQKVDTVHGNLLLVPKKTYMELGGIDGEFAHAYADFDYGLRLTGMGGECLLAPTLLGRCEVNDAPAVASLQIGLLRKWLHMNDRKRSPFRSQVRYLRRHGGAVWPLFVLTPYLKVAYRHSIRRINKPSRQADA